MVNIRYKEPVAWCAARPVWSVHTGFVLLASVLGAASGAAQAALQADSPAISGEASTVQIYGLLDAGVRHLDRASKAGALTQFASGLNTSRFGFRGIESIDGALQGVFRLEGSFNPGTGEKSNSASLFDRTAMAGLRWGHWESRLGRQEGFGYELAAAGITDPLSMALNLPNPAAPAAAGGKGPVLGANPLQGLYSYTYGQLRFNNTLRIATDAPRWSAGLEVALGGVAGAATANGVRGGHVGAVFGSTRWEVLYQQSIDSHGAHSDLGALAGTWAVEAWRLQAGIHQLRLGAGFDSSGLGNGASGSGILGSSTTVSPVLAGPRQDFRLTIADLGATWSMTPRTPLSVVAYRTRSSGAGEGGSVALVALVKYALSPRVFLYAEVDHAASSGTLAAKTVSTGSSELAYMAGLNLRF